MSRKRGKGRQTTPRPAADPGPTLVVAPNERADRDTISAQTELRAPATERVPPRSQGPELSEDRVLVPGTLIGGDYRIMEVLAADVTGISYKAEDINLGVAVLLKEFAPSEFVVRAADDSLIARGEGARDDDTAARAQFLREAQTLVRFRHPNIVRAHRMLEANNTAYIVLDYDDGETFGTWLSALGRPPTQNELDNLVTPLLGALTSVHAAGYVHGDLHRDNVLIRRSGGPLLVNFASARQSGHETDGVWHDADPAFAAPEMLEKDGQRCGPWSDIYSLAALLYLAIMGKLPSEDAGKLANTASRKYRPEFLKAIDEALCASVEDRPQSVDGWAGIRPPDDPNPEPLKALASAPTLVRGGAAGDQGKTLIAPADHDAPTRVAALSQLATRVISALPEIKEETDIPQHGFERWLLSAAFVASFLGALLFATGLNFGLAAVCQVAATGLFFLRGYMPLSRFLSHTTRRVDGIIRRVEQATRTAAWMIAAILALMTVNPLFVERFIPSNTEAPLTMLSVIIALPALIMVACGFFGTPARRTIGSFAVGAANILVLIFSTLLLAGFVYTTLSTPENAVIHPAVQVNRYLYIIATLASGTLGILIFISRLSARQRIKQAVM